MPKSNFNVEYITTHEIALAPIVNPPLQIMVDNADMHKSITFNGERLMSLVELTDKTTSETNEMYELLNTIGFQSSTELKDYINAYEKAVVKIATETNLADKSPAELKQALLDYFTSQPSFLGKTQTSQNIQKRQNCDNDGYRACDKDVSAGLAGDLLECAIATGVTGISSGGVLGIVVGGVCVTNALHQGTLASRACVRNYCS